MVLPARELGERLVAPHGGEVTFIGTATVLVRLGPLRFLTDPNFLHAGQHAPLGYGLRTRRLTDPAMELEDLPPVDFVLLSHHHGDHFDPEVVRRLPRTTTIVTEPGSARKLRRQGFGDVVALATWDSIAFRSGESTVRVIATPARHAPTPLQWALPKVMGSVVEYEVDGVLIHRTYITGDTLVFDGLGEIARRHPDLDLCVMHLGGTRIAGVTLTMDGERGVEALRIIRPRRVMPVHVDDYTVFRSPLEDFLTQLDESGLATELFHVERGETRSIPFG